MATAEHTSTGSICTKPDLESLDDAGGFTFQFEDDSPSGHRIEVEYSRHYVDEIRIERGEVVERSDKNGSFAPDDKIVCSCGKKFGNRDQAKDHLEHFKRRFLDLPPIPEIQRSVTFTEEKSDIYDGCVSGRTSQRNHILLVEEGFSFLTTTARETYKPPKNYDFDDWEPLINGRLRHHYDDKWRPMFRPRELQRALQVLTDNRHSYDPERYTVYFRGKAPIYIEGGGNGVLLAPAIPANVE